MLCGANIQGALRSHHTTWLFLVLLSREGRIGKEHSKVEIYVALGIHVHKYYLHWALKSVNITYIGLFGSLG